MSGETELATLLASMQPHLLEEEYAFVNFPQGRYGDGAHLSPVGAFMEQEGLTLIVPVAKALNNNIAVESRFRCLSLTVHSSLEAVGLTAAMSSALAENGISANVVAAFFHDHVFVPAEQADKAMDVLIKLAESHSD